LNEADHSEHKLPGIFGRILEDGNHGGQCIREISELFRKYGTILIEERLRV